MSVRVIEGDCWTVLPTMGEASADACVTDPPYGLVEPRSGGDGCGRAFAPRTEEAKAARRGGFMGKAWDGTGVAFDLETWKAVLRVLKPGAYLAAFGGTRTYHRMTCAIEDAGFEIRDCIMWVYGTGFPKGQGCLKPGYEPVVLARKPGPRVLPLGIDECRVPVAEGDYDHPGNDGISPEGRHKYNTGWQHANQMPPNPAGRYPANVLHDGSAEVLEAFAAFGESESKAAARGGTCPAPMGWGQPRADGDIVKGHTDSGSAARFFYAAKASKAERGAGNNHPTVKPLNVVRWLVRLVCPEGGTVLDNFGGSGTTGVAAQQEGRSAVLIEREPAYCDIIRKRLAQAEGPLFAEALP